MVASHAQHCHSIGPLTPARARHSKAKTDSKACFLDPSVLFGRVAALIVSNLLLEVSLPEETNERGSVDF